MIRMFDEDHTNHPSPLAVVCPNPVDLIANAVSVNNDEDNLRPGQVNFHQMIGAPII